MADNLNVMENETVFTEDNAMIPAYEETYVSSDSGLSAGEGALIGAAVTAAIGGLAFATKKYVAPWAKTKASEHKAKKAERKAAKEAKKAEKASEQEETPPAEKPAENKKKK